ncbi:MAG: DNA polymerase-3 subunit alpha, partial [Kiritimatiellia bacterium]
MSFVHLHVHSQYSLLDGTMSPKLIAKRAAQLQMPSVALTDSCNLYGGVAFYKACKAHGVRPVLGCVLNVQPEGLEYVDPLEDEGGYKLIALIEDDTGYKNLCRLITDGIFDGVHFKPRVDLQMIEKHRD